MNSKRLSLGMYCLNEIRSLKFILKIIFTILILKLAYHFDPFGISTSSTFYSKTLFYQWTADYHKGSNEKEANPVSVVILRDESFKGEWPVKAIVHAEILEEILELNPKAVFVDFAFIDKRDDDETLKNELIPVINQYLENDIKLYFLSLAPTDRRCTVKIIENKIENGISHFKRKFENNRDKCSILITFSKNLQFAGYNDEKKWIINHLDKKKCVDKDNNCQIDNLQFNEFLNKLSVRAESLKKIQKLLSGLDIDVNLEEMYCLLQNNLTKKINVLLSKVIRKNL